MPITPPSFINIPFFIILFIYLFLAVLGPVHVGWAKQVQPEDPAGCGWTAGHTSEKRSQVSLSKGPKAPWGPRMPDSGLSWKADSVQDPRPLGLNPSSATQPRDGGKSVKLNISSQFQGYDLRLHNMNIASISTSTNCEVHAVFFPFYRKGNWGTEAPQPVQYYVSEPSSKPRYPGSRTPLFHP